MIDDADKPAGRRAPVGSRRICIHTAETSTITGGAPRAPTELGGPGQTISARDWREVKCTATMNDLDGHVVEDIQVVLGYGLVDLVGVVQVYLVKHAGHLL